MINPILKNPRYFIYYLILWTLIGGVHFFVLFYLYDIDINQALIDSLVFNFTFYILGFLLWFPVRFWDNEKKPLLNIIALHLLAAIITIASWVYSGDLILNNIYPQQEEYLLFLENSLLWRSAIGIFFFLIFILFYYSYIYYTNLQEKILQEAELRSLVRDAELNMLKSQINPHFLFNSLNSISALTLKNPDMARDMIVKLSDFFRYSLGKNEKELTSLKTELKNIELYLDIEKIRFQNRLNFTKSINNKCMDLLIPNMILQPLFENAIKHGVYESTETITISLNCLREGDDLNIIISNGREPESVSKKGKGLGLKNIKKRLFLIYGRDDLLRTKSKPESFEVNLLIPQVKSINVNNDINE